MELRPIDPGQGSAIAQCVNESQSGCEGPTRVGSCAKPQGVVNGRQWHVANHRLPGTIQDSVPVVNAFRISYRRDTCRNLA